MKLYYTHYSDYNSWVFIGITLDLKFMETAKHLIEWDNYFTVILQLEIKGN